MLAKMIQPQMAGQGAGKSSRKLNLTSCFIKLNCNISGLKRKAPAVLMAEAMIWSELWSIYDARGDKIGQIV